MKDNTRFIQLVLTSISADKLSAEEELERVINDSSIPIDKKIITTKSLIKDINDCDEMIKTWIELTTVKSDEYLNNENNENNNNNN